MQIQTPEQVKPRVDVIERAFITFDFLIKLKDGEHTYFEHNIYREFVKYCVEIRTAQPPFKIGRFESENPVHVTKINSKEFYEFVNKAKDKFQSMLSQLTTDNGCTIPKVFEI